MDANVVVPGELVPGVVKGPKNTTHTMTGMGAGVGVTADGKTPEGTGYLETGYTSACLYEVDYHVGPRLHYGNRSEGTVVGFLTDG